MCRVVSVASDSHIYKALVCEELAVSCVAMSWRLRLKAGDWCSESGYISCSVHHVSVCVVNDQ